MGFQACAGAEVMLPSLGLPRHRRVLEHQPGALLGLSEAGWLTLLARLTGRVGPDRGTEDLPPLDAVEVELSSLPCTCDY